MTWFKRKTNEGSNPSQSVELNNADIAKVVLRNAYLPLTKKIYLSPASDYSTYDGPLDNLRKYLDENGVEWSRDIDRDAIILTLPSGVVVTITGEMLLKTGSQQGMVDCIMNILDQFEE